MKIMIDIGHPAHVHYFRNFIKIMNEKGHEFFITARNKEVTHELLNYYRIPFKSRGKGRRGYLGKFLYIFEADYKLLKEAKKFNPDLFLSFGSAYAAQVSKIIGKPHIAFDDTEHAKYEHLMYVPFTDIILTPSCFWKKFGAKQIFFNGYMELCYLNKKYFQPDINIKKKLGLKFDGKYVVLRFVSWGASHDTGQSGLSDETKLNLVNFLKSYNYKIFISSEADLPENLEKYKLNIHPAEFHSILAYAQLYIGEGSTTSSECSILGTPNIYVNSLSVGNCKEQEEKYGLCFHLKNDNKVIDIVKELLIRKNLKDEWNNKREKMLSDKIDVTAFMVWFVENYPKSVKILKENPDYQFNFR